MPVRRLCHILSVLAALALVPASLGAQAPEAADAQAAPVSASVSGARLALTRLAAAAGGETGLAEMLGEGKAIYLRGGDTTLEGLAKTLDDRALSETARGYRANLPIVVLRGARLTLGGGDRLVLDRAAGAFLLSFGQVRADRAEITASEDPHPGIEGFRPFVAGIGRSSLSVQNSTLSGLGFPGDPATAGLFIAGRGLLASGEVRPLTGNRFDDLRGVTLSHLDGVEVRGNRFEAMRGTALSVLTSNGATIDGNIVTGTGGAYALRISGGSGQRVSGNQLLQGQGKGARIDDGARGTRVTDTLIEGFGGTGLTVAESAACVLVAGNRVRDNNGAGMRLRDTGGFVLKGNALTGNDGPAIDIARQEANSRGALLGNLLDGNRQGLRASQIAVLELARNDLGGQMPRLLSGDLDQHTPMWLRARAKGDDARLQVQGTRAALNGPAPEDLAETHLDTCLTEERS